MVRTLFAIGLGLLAASAPPLILMARELIVSASVERRYSIDPLRIWSNGMAHGSVRADIGGHAVSLTDDLGELQRCPATSATLVRKDE